MELVLNKNFYNYIGCILFGGVHQANTAAAIGTVYTSGRGYNDGYAVTLPCPLTDTSGANKNGVYFSSYSSNTVPYMHTFFYFNADNVARHPHFTCGSGATPAMIDDTSLVTPNANITAAIDTGKRDTTTSIIYTVTFSASTEQTLREIGLEQEICTANNTYSPVLFGRAVFDEDIILDANTSKTVQIRLALPTLEEQAL